MKQDEARRRRLNKTKFGDYCRLFIASLVVALLSSVLIMVIGDVSVGYRGGKLMILLIGFVSWCAVPVFVGLMIWTFITGRA